MVVQEYPGTSYGDERRRHVLAQGDGVGPRAAREAQVEVELVVHGVQVAAAEEVQPGPRQCEADEAADAGVGKGAGIQPSRDRIPVR